jgi:hypothetical protein
MSDKIENQDIETEVVESVEAEEVETEVVAEETTEEAPAEEVVAEETEAEEVEVEIAEESEEVSEELSEDKDEDEDDEDEDEEVEESMPTTKAGILNAAVEMLKKADAEEAKKIYASMIRKESVEASEEQIAEDIDSVIEGDEVLSEEFKAQAAQMFKDTLAEETARIEAESALQLEEEVASFKTELVEKVDAYLNYVVEGWMEENQVAIEQGLRTEIAEDFMTSLQAVFAEHYIAVPESKVDLVGELSTQVEELEEQLNKTTQENVALFTQVQESTRDSVVRTQCEGLAATEAEKLVSMVEDIDFSDADSFEMKVQTVKESLFAAPVAEESGAELISEETDAEEVVLSGDMARYMQAISKTK